MASASVGKKAMPEENKLNLDQLDIDQVVSLIDSWELGDFMVDQ